MTANPNSGLTMSRKQHHKMEKACFYWEKTNHSAWDCKISLVDILKSKTRVGESSNIT
jgi:hypothetical protein